MSKFEQFFASDKLMITSLIITLAALAVITVLSSIGITVLLRYIFYVALAVIMFFVALTMYRSFAKHETNAMNILTGAATGILLIYYVQRCVSSATDGESLLRILIYAVEAALFAILLINHVQINSIHRNTRGRILLNQIILTVTAACQIFYIIANVIRAVSLPDIMFALSIAILFALAKIFLCFMIICIETKLNAYKTDRDASKAEDTWTEEKKAETKEKYFGK